MSNSEETQQQAGEEEQKNEDGEGKGQTSDNDKDRKRQQYFANELKRLKKGFEREKSKIKKPPYKDHTPYIHTSMEPYYNTYIADYIVNMPPDKPQGYATRPTSNNMCDPWVDHEMDVTVLPRGKGKEMISLPDGKPKYKKGEKRPPREGSTMLPKFPAVNRSETQELSNKTLYYSDVPELRNELISKSNIPMKKKNEEDYKRTKQDFSRMELYRFVDLSQQNRDYMKTTYLTYLQNNPGSKKAIHECVKQTEESKAEETTDDQAEDTDAKDTEPIEQHEPIEQTEQMITA